LTGTWYCGIILLPYYTIKKGEIMGTFFIVAACVAMALSGLIAFVAQWREGDERRNGMYLAIWVALLAIGLFLGALWAQ
jgi:hypothetical protein